MSRFLTRAYILEKYGVRLDMDQLASLLRISKHTLYKQKSDGNLGFAMYTENGRCFADYEEIAKYLDKKSEEARHALAAG